MDTAPQRWYFELFGGLSAQHGEAGRRIERFQTRKTEALLAYLALHPGQRQEREALVDLLWPDADPDAGRNRLTQAVVWLRPLLEPAGITRGSVLLTDRQSVALAADAITTDVTTFEALLSQARSAPELDRRTTLLRSAVELYHGPLLPRLDEEWVLRHRQQLLDRYMATLHDLAIAEEAAGRYELAIAYARRAQAADPLAEEAYLDLIRLLAASGQVSAARRQYREMERVFADALGEGPSAAARTLLDTIHVQENNPPIAPPVPLPRDTPPPSSPLPTPLTRFFGRADEVLQLRTLLLRPDVRLVTLVGIGGAGKTRLAIETAHTLRNHASLWFIPLADIGDVRQIHDAILDILGATRANGIAPLDQVVAMLRAASPSPLLILDNLEHLLSGSEGGAVVPIRILLERIPELTILATSRQRLGLEGEQEWSLLPLPTPTEALTLEPEALLKNDCIRLFVDRAQAVRPGFTLTTQNAAAIVDLCARLEGLPLALELCAAWAQTLTPAQMLTQLTQRFDLLVSRRADIPARHRSLRAAVENSFLMLPPEVQQFFVRLSVFRGGWTLDAAAEVCLEVEGGAKTITALRHITDLRERSLVVADEENDAVAHSVMRYRMLETLREFAAQQRTIAVDAAVRQRHVAYFLALTEEAESQIQGPSQAQILIGLEAEIDNLRAALSWCITSRAISEGLRIASALAFFWDVHGYFAEGMDWLQQLLAAAPTAPDAPESTTDYHRVLARANQALARLARARAAFDVADTVATNALRLWTELGDRQGMAQTLLLLASLAYTHEDYRGARAMQEQALELAEQAGDPLLKAGALLGLGNVAMEEEEWDRAWSLYEECLRLYRRLDNRVLVAATLNNMGLIARYRRDYTTARRLLEENLAMGQTLANRASIAVALLNLGTVLRLQGEQEAAREALREATQLAREVDDRRALAWCLKEYGHLACARGDFPTGVHLLAASENLRQALGMSFKPADPEALEADRTRARAALGEADFETLWLSGYNLPLAEICLEIAEK